LSVLAKGRYAARLAETPEDVASAQRLRHLCFVAARGLGPKGGQDSDRHDEISRHMLVEDAAGALVCCWRMRVFGAGSDLGDSYAADFYDLSRLSAYPAPSVEMGRFCIDPSRQDPDILRLAWGAMTRFVDGAGIGLMFGCASFAGADPARHAGALRHLASRHMAPDRWAPRRIAAEAVGLATLPASRPDPASLPPLLRTYLLMGGWVSDHAVIDRQMDTLHVFTAVETSAVPPARARALRELAA
jgi:putative hemolysin